MAALWTPPTGIAQLKRRPMKRTVILSNGEKALVTVDDSGTVTQVEHGEQLDAIVRPDTIRIKVQRFWGAHGHPKPEGPLKGKDGRYVSG